MKQDAGNDVLGCVDGQGRIEQAAIAGENSIHGDVGEPRVQNRGVEQNQAHMPAAVCADLSRIDSGT